MKTLQVKAIKFYRIAMVAGSTAYSRLLKGLERGLGYNHVNKHIPPTRSALIDGIDIDIPFM